MKPLVFLVTVSAAAAFAQGEEFVLPAFEGPVDAGLPAPSAPPLPEAAPAAGPPKPPPAPSWIQLGGSTALLVSGARDYSVGVELALLLTLLGTPSRAELPGEVEGWLLQAGLEGGYARGGGPRCEGSVFCATRVLGGLALKGGWARALPHTSTGIARPQTMYFGQLDVLLGNYEIESAPLSPGLKTWELVTRLRVGLHLTSDASRVTHTGVSMQVAALVEAIPVSSGTRGVAFGGCVGVGF